MSDTFKIHIYDPLPSGKNRLRELVGKNRLASFFKLPWFSFTDTPKEADFRLLPFPVDPLFRALGPDATRTFLFSLPDFRQTPERWILFFYDDQNLPLGVSAIIFRLTHDHHGRDPNSITIPALVQDPGDRPPPLTFKYHVSFTGSLVSHFCRLQMLAPFLKKHELNHLGQLLPTIERLHHLRSQPDKYRLLYSVLKKELATIFPRRAERKGIVYYFNTTPDYFGHLPPEERPQLTRQQEMVMEQSLMIFCPRGRGSYSGRFFETLAAGRIPILIADNYILPLEWLIDWKQFILRLPQDHLLESHLQLANFFHHEQNDLVKRCLTIRQIWQEYLAPNRFARFLHLALSQVIHSDFNLNRHH